MARTRQQQDFVFHPGHYDPDTGRFILHDTPADSCPAFLGDLTAAGWCLAPGGILEPTKATMPPLRGLFLAGAAAYIGYYVVKKITEE